MISALSNHVGWYNFTIRAYNKGGAQSTEVSFDISFLGEEIVDVVDTYFVTIAFDSRDYPDTAFSELPGDIPETIIKQSVFSTWFSSSLERYPVVRYEVSYDNVRWPMPEELF